MLERAGRERSLPMCSCARGTSAGLLGDRCRCSRNRQGLLDGLCPPAFTRIIAPTQRKALDMSPETSTATVVLVHGAWADGSSWGLVITALQRAGIAVTAAPI